MARTKDSAHGRWQTISLLDPVSVCASKKLSQPRGYPQDYEFFLRQRKAKAVRPRKTEETTEL